ncbi:hypothetical protein [Aquipuribacter hungaricus]|uniref:Uncharacterized protein n=1 Tax=Aquipuribacter hungaricus TaxID=545624 RepID=A0ABV7WG17_9MICO
MSHGDGASSPTGVIVSPDGPGPARQGGWFTPGRPRSVAAALALVAAAVAVLSAAALAELFGVYRGGRMQVVLFWVPMLGVAVAWAALGGLLLTGSRAARVLGGVVVLALSVQTIVPWLGVMWMERVTDQTVLVLVLPVAAVALLHLAVVVALAVPLPARRTTG